MLGVIYLLIALSIGMILAAFLLKRNLRLPDDLKKEEGITRDEKPSAFVATFIFPLNHFLLTKLGDRSKVSWQLQTAGMSTLPEVYLFVKECMAIGFVLAYFIVTKKVDFIWMPVIFLVGLMLPDVHVNNLRKKRNRQIEKALPDVIDLLYLCVGGGLDFMVGMNWVITRSARGPLIDELVHVMHDIKMGKSRQEALKDMSRYLRIPQVSSFVNTLVHGERMGSPIGEILANLADDARLQRFQRAERLALTAPIKMLFPLIFLILPIVMIIVTGPVLLKFLKEGASPALLAK